MTESQLDDLGVDFPQVPPALVGQPFRYGYAAEFNTPGVPWILGYHQYDMVSGSKKSHMLKDGRTGSEATYIQAAKQNQRMMDI